MFSRGIIIFHSYFRIISVRILDAALSKQHYVFPSERFFVQKISEYLFTAVTTICIGVIKGVDAELEAKVNDPLHRGYTCSANVFPPPKAVDSRRNFGS